MLWKERNDRVFNRKLRTVQEVLLWAVDEISAWFQAGYSKLEPVLWALGRLPGRETSSNVII